MEIDRAAILSFIVDQYVLVGRAPEIWGSRTDSFSTSIVILLLNVKDKVIVANGRRSRSIIS